MWNFPKIVSLIPYGNNEGIAKGRQLWHDRILSELSAYLQHERVEKSFSVQELTEIWFGS